MNDSAARSYRWYAPRLDVIRAALPQILHDDRQQADIAAYDALDELGAALFKIATPKRPDGTYNLSREACEQIAKEALGG